MAALVSDERWAFLLERAGLDPAKAPERFAELREGYRAARTAAEIGAPAARPRRRTGAYLRPSKG